MNARVLVELHLAPETVSLVACWDCEKTIPEPAENQ
jgi:hypothetical protein